MCQSYIVGFGVFFGGGGGGLIPLLKTTVVFSCHTITKNPKIFN